MKTIKIQKKIHQPEIEDYNSKYPKIPCNSDQKHNIFGIITDPDNILRALIITEETGSSPVGFYERKLDTAIKNGFLSELSWHEKQFVGTCICLVMEFNGWRKTGKKQRYSKGIFTSAERYVLNSALS
jgi:hypothetical protein